jgi:hypothetical protein
MVMEWEYPARRAIRSSRGAEGIWLPRSQPPTTRGEQEQILTFFPPNQHQQLRLLKTTSEEMLTLQTIRTLLPSPHRSSPYRRALLGRTKRSFICASSPEDAGSGEELPLSGDKRQQEVLAQIAMLQAQKVRITNFLDERSAYLTKFAKDADTEFDLIGQNAMKELDAVGDQVSIFISCNEKLNSLLFVCFLDERPPGVLLILKASSSTRLLFVHCLSLKNCNVSSGR